MPDPPNLLVLTLVVFLCAIVQSLFGVGLLVFGTPSLLLLGWSFEATIAILLPASLILSTIQVRQGRQHLTAWRTSILTYSLPCIVVGLALVLSGLVDLDIKLLVGLALVLSAATRLHGPLRAVVSRVLSRFLGLYMMLMGFVHGLTNMGGGLLTILVTTLHEDKERIRANVAYGYLVFASSQILVLLVMAPKLFGWHVLLQVGVTVATFWTVGRRAYARSSRRMYQSLITIFMLAYGAVLISQRLLR